MCAYAKRSLLTKGSCKNPLKAGPLMEVLQAEAVLVVPLELLELFCMTLQQTRVSRHAEQVLAHSSTMYVSQFCHPKSKPTWHMPRCHQDQAPMHGVFEVQVRDLSTFALCHGKLQRTKRVCCRKTKRMSNEPAHKVAGPARRSSSLPIVVQMPGE